MKGRGRGGMEEGKGDIGKCPQVAFTIIVAIFLKLVVGA